MGAYDWVEDTSLSHKPMTLPIRTFLACWMTVIATGTVVTHRHADVANHSHGFGWTSVTTPADPVWLSHTHRHFVLLGMEFDAIPNAPDQTDSPDVPRAVSALDVSTAPDHAGPVLPAADHPPVSLFVACHSAFETACPPVTIARSANDCPLTSRARSGVLRS